MSKDKMDSRFGMIANDPRFKKVPKSRNKIKLDKRFKDVVTDTKFTSKYTTDKRGRVLGGSAQEDFRKFYAVSESDDEDDDDDEEEKKERDVEEEQSDDSEQSGEDVCEAGEASGSDDGFWARARGEATVDSSSDDEEEAPLAKPEIVHDWAEFDANVEHTEELSRRLAVCNVDWDRVCAKDLLVLLNSFAPKGGSIKSITIYPSEYGKERLAKEDVMGPFESNQQATGKSKARNSAAAAADSEDDEEDEDDEELEEESGEDDGEEDSAKEEGEDSEAEVDASGDEEAEDDDDDDDDGEDAYGSDEFDDAEMDDDSDSDDNEEKPDDAMEKIRQYQLNRLKYYYAVVECNSIGTASKLYDECDGMELELSQTRLDLRFVPDDMTFDDEYKDHATEKDLAGGYEPLTFFSTALQQSKVNMTWDETDVGRLKATMRKFTAGDIQDMDFKAYLASSSSEEEEEEDASCDDESAAEEEDAEVTSPATSSATRAAVPRKSHGQASSGDSTNGSSTGPQATTSRAKAAKAGKSSKGSSVRGDSVAPPSSSAAASGQGRKSYNKYRALMADITAKEDAEDKEQELEVTFESAFGADEASEKSKNEKDSDLTAWEQYQKDKRRKQRLRKKKAAKGEAGDDSDSDEVPQDFDFNDPFFAGEDTALSKKDSKKKKKKRGLTEEEQREEAELKLLMVDDEQDEKKHFSLKRIQEQEKLEAMGSSKKKWRKKRKREEEDEDGANAQPEFKMDNDPRFSAIFSDAKFAIDPSAPNFKKTKVMDDLVKERHRRRIDQREEAEKQEIERQSSGKTAGQHAMSALIKSTKSHSRSFKRKS
ncbi:ESF1 homolog [Sycon ciliatum]|uniref:ESF1 homolog n=1 Tax=Sycon ciliatum TaxID=27933 RepID=UPI0031F70453